MDEKHKDHDRLVQRMLVLQSVLSKLGFEEDFDEEDIKREYANLPKDSEDYLDFRIAQDKAEKAKEEAKDDEYVSFDLGYEPFKPDDSEESSTEEPKQVSESPKLNPLGKPVSMPNYKVAVPKEGPGSW